MYLTKKDLILIAALSCLFFLFSIMAWLLVKELFFVVALTCLCTIALGANFYFYRRILQHFIHQHDNRLQTYSQIEALFSLFSLIDIKHPLPRMRRWAICPDFANLVVSMIQEKKPELIVELGCGSSTVVSGYFLKKMGQGKVLSLEHDKKYADYSKDVLVKHQLQDIATIKHTPLVEYEIDGEKYNWYDTSKIDKDLSIDILVVDGPPYHVRNELARYPALPVLFDRLSDDAVIILDDTIRADEQKVVDLWLKKFPGFQREDLDLEVGAIILRRSLK